MMIGETIVHDIGFVKLLDIMGSDEEVENAARISYGEGTRKVSQTRNLIRYLMRHKHTSPFEMCEVKFHINFLFSLCVNWSDIGQLILMNILVDIP